MQYLLATLALCWASPNTLLGLLIGGLGCCTGGTVRRYGRVLEFHGGGTSWLLNRVPGDGYIYAMTLGHTLLGQSAEALDISRRHEMVHVRQCEIWGPFFLPAYGLASLYMWLTGRRAYRDNPFERQAYAVDGDPWQAHVCQTKPKPKSPPGSQTS